MKKYFTIVASAILVGASAFAINWGDGDGQIANLAQGADVIASSNFEAAKTITNNGGNWQADPATRAYTNDWALIDLGEAKKFTDMEIRWEASHCKQYDVFVLNEKPAITEVEAVDGVNPAYKTVDVTGLTATISGGDDTEANYTEKFRFTEQQDAQFILIYGKEYNNYGTTWGMRIFEVRVANIENIDEILELTLEQSGKAVTGEAAATVSVSALNAGGDKVGVDQITDLQLTGEGAIIEKTAEGEYTVTADRPGNYTIVATAKAGDKVVTGSTVVTVEKPAYKWDGVENQATGKTVQGRIKADTEDNNPVANATDGNEETFYQYNGEWGGGDSWLIVDLGADYMVEAIGASYGATSAGVCVFGYATDITKTQANIEEKGTDKVFQNELKGEGEWTETASLSRADNTIVTNEYETPVRARYILVRDADNPGGKPCVNEIYVKGTKREAERADKIAISLEKGGMLIGDTCTVTASVVDQYGDPFAGEVTINVEGADYADGAITTKTEGMVTVTATCGEMTAEAKFYVADPETYCANGAQVIAKSEGAAENTEIIFDGGKDINFNGAENYVLAPEESEGEHLHWFTAKLSKPCNINLIALNWEGACPTDYDIYLGETEDNMQLFYSERNKAGFNAWKDRFSGKDMLNIQYIKVVSTKNATIWGIKLHDMKVYGQSAVPSVATSIEASAAQTNVNVEAEVALTAVVKDQFGDVMDVNVDFTCADKNATITDGIFKAAAIGEYTIIAKYEELTAEVKVTVKKNLQQFYTMPVTKYTTMVLPYEAEVPEGYEVYSVTGTADSKFGYTLLTMNKEEKVEAYKPYVIFWNETAGDGTCQFNGDITTETDANVYENGLLRGVMMNGNAPEGSYTLDTRGNNTFGFYPAAEALVNVYDLNGTLVRKNVKACEALQGLQKGIYVVGGAKKAVK